MSGGIRPFFYKSMDEMRLAALCSCGKDSSYSLWLALKEDHEVTHLVAMVPEREDSWMFHRPDLHIVELFSESAGIPLVKGRTSGFKERELEDLRLSLEDIPVDGVVNGAVASNYQKKRIEQICDDLELVSLTPLWERDSLSLLKGMLEDDFEIIITSVSAGGLGERWIGRRIDQDCLEELKRVRKEYGVHLMGEGGEYETLVLDAPFMRRRIVLTETERIWRGDRGYLRINESKLAEK